jgi:ABC-type phosphonate transport system ATPase subunit
MQNVGKPVTSPSPDIVLIPVQGRDSDAVHQDIQNARQTVAAARLSHEAAPSGTLTSGVKDRLKAMMMKAHAERDLTPTIGTTPDTDAPCPIP